MRACPTSVPKAFSYTALGAAIDHEEKVEDEEKVETKRCLCRLAAWTPKSTNKKASSNMDIPEATPGCTVEKAEM